MNGFNQLRDIAGKGAELTVQDYRNIIRLSCNGAILLELIDKLHEYGNSSNNLLRKEPELMKLWTEYASGCEEY